MNRGAVFPPEIEERAKINGKKRQTRKRAREDQKEKKAIELLHMQRTERLMELLEKAGDEDVLVKAVEFPSEVVHQFEPYYKVLAQYEDGEDYYHSWWRIGTKE